MNKTISELLIITFKSNYKIKYQKRSITLKCIIVGNVPRVPKTLDTLQTLEISIENILAASKIK